MTKTPIDPVLPPAPSTCGAVQDHVSYRVLGTFTACSQCDNETGSAWDGLFTRVTPFNCVWEADPAAGINIGGKLLLTTGGHSIIRLNTAFPRWEMNIDCGQFVFDPNDVWVGQKLTGLTADGVYTRILGCDSAATRTVLHVT